MPTVLLHSPSPERRAPTSSLPELLHTPLGLAILELQGTINFPHPEHADDKASVDIGRLVFPDYDPSLGGQEGKWMKRVWFYVGHQRMNGEVKKLPKPLGVLRRSVRASSTGLASGAEGGSQEGAEGASTTDELEIAEIVRWKLVFSSRPEPVGLSGT